MASKVEKYISDCTRNCSNELCSVEDRYGKTIISYHEWLTPDQALRAAEIAKKETIEKACEWLENNLSQEVSVISGGYVHINFENSIKEFRKAMED